MPKLTLDVPEDLLARIDHPVELRHRTREELVLEWLRQAVDAPWGGDPYDDDQGGGCGGMWDEG